MTPATLNDIPPLGAARDPEATAYRFMGQSLSFADFDQRVAQLSFVLQEQGVKPGDRVCICLRKSFESAVAAFAIMAAGGVYVPLDPTAPMARWAQIIEQSDARHLVSDTNMQNRLNGLLGQVIGLRCVIGAQGLGLCTGISWDDVHKAPRAVAVPRDGSDPAYIMFTSGSTGTPKGMVHTHDSALSYLRATIDLFGMTAQDRIALHAGLHFDVSLWPMLGAPLVGGTCVIVPEAYTRLPAEMSKLMEDEALTLWYSVPFALNQILEAGALDKRDLGSLRWVSYAGEPFAPEPLRALMRALPQARFTNQYGPAEVNVVTYMHIEHPEDVPDAGVPIGRGFGPTKVLHLDADDYPVAAGQEGELLFTTPAMMQGYWRDPARTAQSMLMVEGERYYRSGDIAVQHGDGIYHLVGRKDRQIKVRGARLELDEVELVLNTHPDITEAAVMAKAGGLLAAVVLKPGTKWDMAALRAHAAMHLPIYGVPDHIHQMERFPRTGSGKIDRRAIATQLA